MRSSKQDNIEILTLKEIKSEGVFCLHIIKTRIQFLLIRSNKQLKYNALNYISQNLFVREDGNNLHYCKRSVETLNAMPLKFEIHSMNMMGYNLRKIPFSGYINKISIKYPKNKVKNMKIPHMCWEIIIYLYSIMIKYFLD